MKRRVHLHPVHAAPALKAMAALLRRRIKHALSLLAQDPSGRSDNLNVKKLEADADIPVHRARIGDWRIAFSFDAKVLQVARIFHRSEGYDWLAEAED